MSISTEELPMIGASDNSFWFSTFQEHGSSLLAFLRSRVGRRDLAEDLLQETFVRAMQGVDRTLEPAKIRSYLFTTAYHLVIDQRRRKKPLLFSEAGPDGAEAFEERQVDPDLDLDRAVELELLSQRLTATLKGLPADQRQAFELAVLQQCPYAEVARTLGWTLAKVKITVYRARKTIIERMQRKLRAVPEKPS